jgi:hypothetical protein
MLISRPASYLDIGGFMGRKLLGIDKIIDEAEGQRVFRHQLAAPGQRVA